MNYQDLLERLARDLPQYGYNAGQGEFGWVWSLGIWVAVIAAILFFCWLSIVIVQQQKFVVIERLGKFARIANPGLNFKIPLIETVAGDDTVRIQQLDVSVETKTKDNVFVIVKISVQFQVIKAKAYEAFYMLEDPEPQIKSYVFDVVRATVPRIDLDDVFEKKDDVAQAVKKELAETMDDFGYLILQALVTDIDPDSKVKESMNEINAAQRLRMAANEKGEAEKILKVKAAEAESESKKLQGEGIANQRKAIIDGLRASVSEFKDAVEGTTAQEVLNLVLMTQYFDTLKDIGASSQTNTILIPHSPGNLSELSEQMRNAMITAQQVK